METEKDTDIVGAATTLDGRRVPITRAEASAIWQSAQAADAARRAAMPTSMDALQVLHDAKTRLRDEGWRDAIYCPKDGTEFAVIQFGSTGIFQGFYSGKWPDGHIVMGDCACNPGGHLWKPLDALDPAERAKMEECTEAERRMTDAFAARMAGLADSLADEIEARHDR